MVFSTIKAGKSKANSPLWPKFEQPGPVAPSEACPLGMHILSWRLGHKKISTAILPLLLIQEEQLSVTGKRMCTKYW